MKNKYLISENKRSIKTESNYKTKLLNKKQRNDGKITYTKRITFAKYLLDKNIKISNNNKKKTIPKISYNKRYNFPLININKIKRKEKKSDLIISYNIMDIQIQEQNEKEKIIEQLLYLKDDMEEQNLQLNLLKFYYNKLHDANLTYKTIIEKILNINDNKNDNNNNNEHSNEIHSKSEKKTLKEKKINLLKIQIVNYDKNIEKQNEILNEEKKEKNINYFLNMNKLINHKNKELENLILDGKKCQTIYNDIDNKYDFFNNSIKSYKDINFKLKIKFEMNKKENKLNDEKIIKIKKEIEEVKDNLYKLEKELFFIEQNNKEKKEQKGKLKNKYEENVDLKKEKEKYHEELNSFYKKNEDLRKIIEKNEKKINIIKTDNKNSEIRLSILMEENNKKKEKVSQIDKNKIMMKNYEKEIKSIKEEIEKNKNEEKQKIIEEKKEKERIKKEIEEFEKAKIGLINKINELNKELDNRTKEQVLKEKELEKASQEYNLIIKGKI